MAVLLPTIVLAAHGALYGRWVVDDASIVWAYARSILSGAGPVLQPGGPAAEGWSDPAWLGVWIVLVWLGVPLLAAVKVLGVALGAVTFAGLYMAARALVPDRAVMVAVCAGTVTACVPAFAAWSVSGLENPLYAAAVVWLVAVTARGPASWRTAAAAGLLAALVALTRPDGVVYLVVFPLVAVLVLKRRGLLPAAVSIVAALVPFGVYLAWRRATFGLWVPNTALAKRQGLPDWRPLLDLAPAVGPLLVGMLLLAVTGSARRLWVEARSAVGAVGVGVVCALGAFAVLAKDWTTLLRFSTPLWPLLALAVCALAAAGVGAARWAPVAAAVVVAAVSAPVWVTQAVEFRAEPDVPVCLVAQINGREINAYAELAGVQHGTLLVPDVGGAALVGRMTVIDFAGLGDPVIGPATGRQDMATIRAYVFDRVRPTFISGHDSWYSTGVLSDPRLYAAYEQVSLPLYGHGALWVRRDVLGPGELDAMRTYRQQVGAPAERAVRDTPRAGCAL